MARSFKVDNWGTLLLQRIQQLYERGEHCDIMLKFHTGEESPVNSNVCLYSCSPIEWESLYFQVHRMVFHAWCGFFAVLECTEPLENSTLPLSAELTKEALELVIRFVYLGKIVIFYYYII